MKRVYVASPLRSNIKAHIQLAKDLCHAAVSGVGVAALAPHVFYTSFLNDEIERERELGMKAGHEWLLCCDELWVFTAKGISFGMRAEIDMAKELETDVVYDPPCWDLIAARVRAEIEAAGDEGGSPKTILVQGASGPELVHVSPGIWSGLSDDD